MPAPLTLGVLGNVMLERQGRRLSLGGPKAQQIIAVLAANHGRPVRSDALVDALWNHECPPSTSSIVQSHVSRLRSVLAPEIEIVRDADGYRLALADTALDAARFELLLARARAAAPAESLGLLEQAVRIWRGPAFGEHAELDLVRAEAVRLDELRLAALDEWASAKLGAGEAGPMVGELEALIAQHPFRERFWILLMLALYATGRQTDALRRAADLREMLGREVGLDVSPMVREVEAQILANDPALRTTVVAVPPPALGTSRAAPSALLGSTSFIGREPDVTDLVSALHHHPLVTVSGAGGVGKTRLALRAVAAYAEEFHGDVTVVPLAPLRDAAGVPEVIARALDIQQRQYRTLEETIEEYLLPRRAVLVLDNCEHVLEAVAPLTDRLRSSCRRLTIVATSRQPLGLAGEYVMVVAPLSLPPQEDGSSLATAAHSAAVELFVARAASSVPGFTLDEINAPAVVRICRRLDGLPLGIELAAARLRVMGVEVLADRLERRVQSLGQLQRSGDGRQRTLVELVQWSYDLLAPAARQVFAQLAVFAGGFDLAAVEAICSTEDGDAVNTVDTLASLVEQSMVILVDAQVPRYRLLEPLREFALDRLVEEGSLASVEQRHLDWYLALAVRASAGLDTPDEATWSGQLERDFDNLRAAHQWSVVSENTDAAFRLVAALREFSFRAVQYEVVAWADDVATMAGAHRHPEYSTILAMGGYGRWVRGDIEAAIRAGHRALEALPAGERSDSGLPERVLSNTYFYLGHREEGMMWMDRMLDSAVAAGDDARRAHGLYMRSVSRTSIGENVRGAIFAGEARAAADLVGSPTAIAQAHYALGLAMEGSDQSEAVIHLEHAARLARSAGNRWIEAFALTEVHWLRARQGEHLAGLAGFAGVVRTWYRGGDWANQRLSLRYVFGILIDLGAFEEAAVLHGALAAVGAAEALPFEPSEAEHLAGVVDDLRSMLGPGRFADAVRRGASMSDGEIVEFVIGKIDALTQP